jgi:hypothetical protein
LCREQIMKLTGKQFSPFRLPRSLVPIRSTYLPKYPIMFLLNM